MWTNDSKRILMEHFDAIQNSPSYLYHYALPFCPSSSWLYECYIVELLQEVRVVEGLQEEWGMCSCILPLNCKPSTLSYQNNSIAVGSEYEDILILDAITGSQTAILNGHKGEVTSVAFSPDGALLVSGSSDRTIKLWDIQTGGIVKTFCGHTGWIYSVSISADNTTIASVSEGGKLYFWNIQTGACYKTIQQQGDIYHVTFSPKDPQILMSVSTQTVQQWNIDGHKVGPAYDGRQIAFSPDGTQLMLCTDNSITIQNTNSGAVVARIHKHARSCCFSPDGTLIAVASGISVSIWNIAGSDPHRVLSFIAHTVAITSLVFSSNCTLVSISPDKSIKFWQLDIPSTDPVVTDKKSIPLTPTPTRPVVLKAKIGPIIPGDLPDGVMKTWGISTGQCKESLQTPADDSHQSSTQLNDNKLIFVWYADKKINIWDAEKGKLLQTIKIPGGTVLDLRVSGDGSKVFCEYWDAIQAWDIWTGKTMGEVKLDDGRKTLMIDGSTIWINILAQDEDLHYHNQTQGWDFGTPGSLPVQASNKLPNELHLNDTKVWKIRTSGIKDVVTGKVVFQLPERFGKPFHVQLGGQYLVISFRSQKVLILDFGHISL